MSLKKTRAEMKLTPEQIPPYHSSELVNLMKLQSNNW